MENNDYFVSTHYTSVTLLQIFHIFSHVTHIKMLPFGGYNTSCFKEEETCSEMEIIVQNHIPGQHIRQDLSKILSSNP